MNDIKIFSPQGFWVDLSVFLKANSHITIIADLVLAVILILLSLYYAKFGAAKLKNKNTPKILFIAGVVAAIAAALNWVIVYFMF